MKTFLTLLLFFPSWCLGQEQLSDTVSYFRFNGKTYYGRDSLGQFKPAIAMYEQIDKNKPSLGYFHTIAIFDNLEKMQLIIITQPTMPLPKILDKKYGGKRGIFSIYSAKDTLNSAYTNVTLCENDPQKSLVCFPPPGISELMAGGFEADVYRRIGEHEYDCQMKYMIDGYFLAVYAPEPKEKSKK